MMEASHYPNGDRELLRYNVAKTPEHDGKVTFVHNEVHAQKAGLEDHLGSREECDEFDAFPAWLGDCEVTAVLDGDVRHTLC